jgi:hypothetical protein
MRVVGRTYMSRRTQHPLCGQSTSSLRLRQWRLSDGKEETIV